MGRRKWREAKRQTIKKKCGDRCRRTGTTEESGGGNTDAEEEQKKGNRQTK